MKGLGFNLHYIEGMTLAVVVVQVTFWWMSRWSAYLRILLHQAGSFQVRPVAENLNVDSRPSYFNRSLVGLSSYNKALEAGTAANLSQHSIVVSILTSCMR